MCPPYSSYETIPGKIRWPRLSHEIRRLTIAFKAYHSAPPTSGYDGAVSRAYSTDLVSPVHTQVPEYPVVSSSGPGQSGLFDMEDPTPATHLPNYPALQPVSHYGNQPTTSPENMVYPSLHTDHGFLKSEPSPVFLKSEGAGQSFRSSEFQSGPTPTHPGETDYTHATAPRAEDDGYIRHSLVDYQLPPRYRVPHGYVHADGLGSEQVGHCQIVPQGNGLEVVLPNHKPPSTKRGPFKNQEKRQQTAHVRKIGSCIRCRMQRIRVGEANTPGGRLTLTSGTSAKPIPMPLMTMMPHVMVARRYLPIRRSTVFLVGGGRLRKSSSSSQARSKGMNGHAAGKMALLGLTSASGQASRSRSSD